MNMIIFLALHLSTTASTLSSLPFTFCDCVRWCLGIYVLMMNPNGTEYKTANS